MADGGLRYLSLFSGMEAAHIAWAPLGWTCVGVAEIDPAACALLRHRLPGVPNLGSVTEITAAAVAKLGRVDVVIGGSPCQDLSVAGKRAGLAGNRSSLFHEQLRIFDAARTLCGARWLVWENVPGAFSSNQGRDFAVVVGAMAGCELDVPADGWGNEGVALGDNGLVEWAVLDSQWFGVAQRRRRVFAVLDTGDWAGRPPVLLEPDRLRGDSAPSREAGEGVAGTLTGGARDRGGFSADDGELIPEIAGTVGCHSSSGRSFGSSPIPDNLVPVAFDTTQITSRSNISNPRPGDPCHPLWAGAHPPAIAFGCKDSDPARSVSTEVSPTLRAMGHADSHANAGGQVAVAFAHQGGGTQSTLGYDPESGTSPTLSVGQTPAVHHRMGVRRLTPRECERLQAAPDDWTLVPNAKGKPMADGPRYKMLGNSFTGSVIHWIGTQIQRAHRWPDDRETAAAPAASSELESPVAEDPGDLADIVLKEPAGFRVRTVMEAGELVLPVDGAGSVADLDPQPPAGAVVLGDAAVDLPLVDCAVHGGVPLPDRGTNCAPGLGLPARGSWNQQPGRHLSRRQPKKRAGFSWGRFPDADQATAVEWRLFRRDHTGRLQFEYRLFLADTPRAEIAPVLLTTRRLLRERVDEIDLAALMEDAA